MGAGVSDNLPKCCGGKGGTNEKEINTEQLQQQSQSKASKQKKGKKTKKNTKVVNNVKDNYEKEKDADNDIKHNQNVNYTNDQKDIDAYSNNIQNKKDNMDEYVKLVQETDAKRKTGTLNVKDYMTEPGILMYLGIEPGISIAASINTKSGINKDDKTVSINNDPFGFVYKNTHAYSGAEHKQCVGEMMSLMIPGPTTRPSRPNYDLDDDFDDDDPDYYPNDFNNRVPRRTRDKLISDADAKQFVETWSKLNVYQQKVYTMKFLKILVKGAADILNPNSTNLFQGVPDKDITLMNNRLNHDIGARDWDDIKSDNPNDFGDVGDHGDLSKRASKEAKENMKYIELVEELDRKQLECTMDVYDYENNQGIIGYLGYQIQLDAIDAMNLKNYDPSHNDDNKTFNGEYDPFKYVYDYWNTYTDDKKKQCMTNITEILKKIDGKQLKNHLKNYDDNNNDDYNIDYDYDMYEPDDEDYNRSSHIKSPDFGKYIKMMYAALNKFGKKVYLLKYWIFVAEDPLSKATWMDFKNPDNLSKINFMNQVLNKGPSGIINQGRPLGIPSNVQPSHHPINKGGPMGIPTAVDRDPILDNPLIAKQTKDNNKYIELVKELDVTKRQKTIDIRDYKDEPGVIIYLGYLMTLDMVNKFNASMQRKNVRQTNNIFRAAYDPFKYVYEYWQTYNAQQKEASMKMIDEFIKKLMNDQDNKQYGPYDQNDKDFNKSSNISAKFTNFGIYIKQIFQLLNNFEQKVYILKYYIFVGKEHKAFNGKDIDFDNMNDPLVTKKINQMNLILNQGMMVGMMGALGGALGGLADGIANDQPNSTPGDCKQM